MLDPNILIQERASFARDVEYIRNITEDALIQESMLTLENHNKGVCGIFESNDDEKADKELEKASEEIPTDRDYEKEEISRIVNAKKDMSIDDIMGISDDEDDEENAAIAIAEDLVNDDNDDEE